MGGETSDPFTPALDQAIKKLMNEWHVPGMSIAITSHGRVSSKGYGYADLKSKTPVDPNNLFYVASITKHMFSAAFLKYLESDKNQRGCQHTLQTPLAEIIREDFVLKSPHATTSTTIEDALSHRSGLGRFDMTYGGSLNTARKITQHLRHLILTEAPRTKFQYCNIMYMVATHALQTLTDTPFSEYMSKTIFDPLGMNHTFGTLSDAQDASEGSYRLATPYAWENDQYARRQYLDGPVACGAGALISNVTDWAKWLNAMLQKTGPVTQTIFDGITSPRIVAECDPTEPWDNITLYCLGLNRFNYRSVEIFAHTGGHCGFTGNMILIPSLQFGAIMFCNSEAAGGNALVSLGYTLVDELLRVPSSERRDGNRVLRKRNEEFEKRLREARARIYPSIPSPPLPPALPLHAYAGSYYNPAFRTFTFVAQEPLSRQPENEKEPGDGNGRAGRAFLLAQPQDRFWPMTIQLEHVTGEFWFGRSLSLLRFGFKAHFVLDEMGKVSQLGMALEETDEKELWWFERFDSGSESDNAQEQSPEVLSEEGHRPMSWR